MDRNILKIQKWRKTHAELLEFINNENTVTGDEIRSWIAQCIVYFTEINIPESIIEYFLSKIEYHKEKAGKNVLLPILSPGDHHDDEDKYYYNTGIGPFTYDQYRGGYVLSKEGGNRLLGKQVDNTKMTPILVAFKVAENILDNYEEEERIIPKSLIEQFNTEKNQSLYVALNGIQNSYEEKNTKDMLTSIITTTSLICDLIPELSAIKDIGPKIKKIYETSSIYEKYNLNREVLWAINNSRIIRNYDIHKPEKLNHTTLYEAVGYVHLLVLFIISMFSSGEIKLE